MIFAERVFLWYEVDGLLLPTSSGDFVSVLGLLILGEPLVALRTRFDSIFRTAGLGDKVSWGVTGGGLVGSDPRTGATARENNIPAGDGFGFGAPAGGLGGGTLGGEGTTAWPAFLTDSGERELDIETISPCLGPTKKKMKA